MKITISIKCINPKFDQELADNFFGGEESEVNVKVLWEDEFVVKGDVLNFAIRNKQAFVLKGIYPNEEKFEFSIPDCTIIEFQYEDGSVGQFPISRKLIHSTNKVVSKNGSQIIFEVNLKGSKKIANPMDGAYFIEEDFPSSLIEFCRPLDEDDE